jgi:nicotinamide riboside kinase
MSSKRVIVTGTESTGKTTLCEQLQHHYDCIYIPDVSRDYIAALNRAYTYEDVLQIARDIIAVEDEAIAKKQSLIISDNDLINTKIWLQYYSWAVPQWLEDAIITRQPDLVLLCNIDLPWVADEQRANPNDRDALFQQFIAELNKLGSKYQLISGDSTQRLQTAVNHIDFLLTK